MLMLMYCLLNSIVLCSKVMCWRSRTHLTKRSCRSSGFAEIVNSTNMDVDRFSE